MLASQSVLLTNLPALLRGSTRTHVCMHVDAEPGYSAAPTPLRHVAIIIFAPFSSGRSNRRSNPQNPTKGLSRQFLAPSTFLQSPIAVDSRWAAHRGCRSISGVYRYAAKPARQSPSCPADHPLFCLLLLHSKPTCPALTAPRSDHGMLVKRAAAYNAAVAAHRRLLLKRQRPRAIPRQLLLLA